LHPVRRAANLPTMTIVIIVNFALRRSFASGYRLPRQPSGRHARKLREELSTQDLVVFGQTESVAGVPSAPGEALLPQECAALARWAALEEPAVRSATGETESVVLWEDEGSIA
jgi:hypothetical protein